MTNGFRRFAARLAATFTALALAGMASAAITVSPGDQLVLTTVDGEITVGVGVGLDHEVQIGLLDGFEGTATLTIRHGDGTTVEFEVVVHEDDTIEFVAGPDAGAILAELVAEGALDLSVTREGDVTISSAADALDEAWANAPEQAGPGLCQAARSVGVILTDPEASECTPASERERDEEEPSEEAEEEREGPPSDAPGGPEDTPADSDDAPAGAEDTPAGTNDVPAGSDDAPGPPVVVPSGPGDAPTGAPL